jgi:DNA polymerase-3 subunit delta
MASGPRRGPPGRGGGAPRGDAASLELCLADARAGTARPVYLFDGDPFLAGRAVRELVLALVPEDRRALNLVELDAAASPGEVAAELATGGLFGGGKVVLVHEPAFLTSKDEAGEAFRRAREQWREGRQREAARRLLALAAKAGWSAKDLDGEEAPSAADWARELGVHADEYDAAFVAGAARWAIERDLKVAKDDAGALDALLAGGLPAGHVLVVAAGKVDGRLPLVKRLAGAGRRVTLGVERTGTWNDERLVLRPVIEALLAGTGKRVDAAAEERLAALVGDDTRALASELAKLAAYVGDRKTISADDVEELVTRVASDPFFALGNAVEARDLAGALAVLDRSLADGASPHMIVGGLAATVRRLVVELERARAAAGDQPIRTLEEWKSKVLPAISKDELGDRKPFGLWMKYQAARRFARGELLDALASLAEADVGMKSGGDGRLLLERALWTALAPTRTRSEA